MTQSGLHTTFGEAPVILKRFVDDPTRAPLHNFPPWTGLSSLWYFCTYVKVLNTV